MIITLIVLKIDLFFHAIYLSSLALSTSKRRTNALAKNLRQGFLAQGVKKGM